MPRQLRRSVPNRTIELHEDASADLGGGTACVHCRPRRRLRAADGNRMSRVKLIRWLRFHGLQLGPSRALADDYGTRSPADFDNDGDS